MFSGLWASIKAARSVAYFGQAMNSGGTGDLRSKWKQNKGNFRTRLMLSGVIMASTIALATQGLFRFGKRSWNKHQDRKAQREHDQAMIEKAKIIHGNSNANPTPTPPSQPELVNPVPINNPNESNNSNLVNPKDLEQTSDNPFENDIPIGARRFDLEQNLIVMKEDLDKSNMYYAVIKTAHGEPNLYVTGSGIYDKEHHPYYNLEARNQKTLSLACFLEQLNQHEYPDALTLFELFDN